MFDVDFVADNSEAKGVEQNVTTLDMHNTYKYLDTARPVYAGSKTLFGNWNPPDSETCKHCYGLRPEAV